MVIDKSQAVTLEKDGQVYYFCSEHCKRQFQAQGDQAPDHTAHAGHHAHMVADFQRRFWISLVVTVPIVILSPMIGLTGDSPGGGWLLFLLSPFVFFYGGKVQGLIALADLIRDGVPEAVRMLKNLGLKVAMITGDNESTARHVAERLGLNTYFAEVLPDQKSERIRELQRLGQKVAMVGDYGLRATTWSRFRWRPGCCTATAWCCRRRWARW